MDYKSILESKTFWVNLIFFAMDVLASPAVLNLIPAVDMPLVAAVQAVANIGLRYLTRQPVVIGTPAQANSKNQGG